jgi:uncharacterized protein (TIGR00725 family)
VLHVAVIGPGDAPEGSDEWIAAETVGGLLAEAGAVVVTGGLQGVMAAASRGASDAGGTTVGLLPGVDRAAANRWVTVAVPTGLGEGRNLLIVRAADAVVAIGGGYGTLSEIALALRAGITVVGLATWELHRDGAPDGGIVPAAGAGEAAILALAAAGGRD